MEENEINKIIAGFMSVGCDEQYKGGCNWNSGASDTCNSCTKAVLGQLDFFRYTKSLDALVPVWEKLGEEISLYIKTSKMIISKQVRASCELYIYRNNIKTSEAIQFNNDSSIALTTAHATAKAILELKESQK